MYKDKGLPLQDFESFLNEDLNLRSDYQFKIMNYCTNTTISDTKQLKQLFNKLQKRKIYFIALTLHYQV